MSKYIVDIHGDIEGDYEIIKKYEEQESETMHWLSVIDKTGHLVWECDKCGWQQRRYTNYCPDCGAKLEDKGYEQGYKDGYLKGFEEGVVLG